LVTLTGIAVLVFLFHAPLLSALGRYLVLEDAPQKADAVVVLSGDSWGHRVMKGGELVRAGFAPVAVVSGPDGEYGNHECDLAIPFAVKAGYPESYFLHAEHKARSTVEEAEDLAPLLHGKGYRKILLVTSNYHTRRSAAVFRRAIPDIEFVVIAAPDQFFNPDSWWQVREARKTFLYEWEKTVASVFGI